MCAFIPIAMAVVTAAQSAMQINQQNAAADAQMDAAEAAANQDYVMLARKQDEVGKKEALEATERMRQGMRERAKMRVAAGESGVGGNSPFRVLANSFMQQSYDVGIMETRRDDQLMSIQDEKYKVRADAASRINVAESNTVKPLMAGLQIGGAAFKGYMGGMSMAKGASS